MRVSLLAASEKEVAWVHKEITNCRRTRHQMVEVLSGTINDVEVVFAITGVGKVSTAISTQVIIDFFPTDLCIMLGTAGILNPVLSPGDVVICKDFLQYDVSRPASAKDFDDPYTRRFATFSATEHLVKAAIHTTHRRKAVQERKILIGRVLTGECWLEEENTAQKLFSQLQGDIVDQEVAAFAQACTMSQKNFVAFKAVTDWPGLGNRDVYKTNLQLASLELKSFFFDFLDTLCGY